MLLLAIGCYFWMVGDDKSSLPLALLEEKSIDSLPDDEIVLVENGSWVQLKNGATITHDNIGKPSVKDSQIKKKVLATKTGNLNQIIVPKGQAGKYYIFRWYPDICKCRYPCDLSGRVC